MIRLNISSISDKVKGQGVDSAFKDQASMLKKSKILEVSINSEEIKDICHIHTLDLKNFFLMKKYKRKNKKVVVSAHMVPDSIEDSLNIPKLFKKIFYKYMINFYKTADKCVVVNSYYKEELIKLGVKKENVLFIPNIANKDLFYNMKIKNQLRKKYNIEDSKFVVVGSGQVQKRKGIDDFVKTAEVNNNMLFIWVGGFSFGKITSGYEKYKAIYDNPPKNVIFTGIVDRNTVVDYLNLSDVFFLPSYQELFPMSLLEASNCDMPLLLRDIELYKEILYDKYLKGNSYEEFSNILKELNENEDFYNSALNKSIELSEIYSEKNVIKQWENLYESLM
ncbi:1,2-diacylglycerol-3-alpha-glucose alpha-1,2-galactosyltransferase [Oceanotoga teriensis]|uniref:1,2-diacylglycerol-3-alpha-glucose alpha-1,2-galactosyltransferase n=1 Tax=Oceanotoga teriensis TaxID=515440 RepID=A0AA45C4J5_9BACT|nr:glycosyltransferase family 4 protein [Oceanotoga teriensis]PWJ86110.1 1,2-diacylglycerol-3-alpha-glucose alpha-1,2-galactosyltransferase [Oceanotoga teriensis]